MNKLQISRKIKEATEGMLSGPPKRKKARPAQTLNCFFKLNGEIINPAKIETAIIAADRIVAS